MTSRALPQDREMVPRVLLRAMFGLVFAVLLLVTFAKVTDRPLEAVPANGPVAQERVIYIEGSMSGSAIVHDADGSLVADLDATQGGFIAGVWRALNHERGRRGVDLTAPVRLVQFEDGRLALFDDSTEFRIELIGFGADNTAAFARLLKN